MFISHVSDERLMDMDAHYQLVLLHMRPIWCPVRVVIQEQTGLTEAEIELEKKTLLTLFRAQKKLSSKVWKRSFAPDITKSDGQCGQMWGKWVNFGHYHISHYFTETAFVECARTLRFQWLDQSPDIKAWEMSRKRTGQVWEALKNCNWVCLRQQVLSVQNRVLSMERLKDGLLCL